MMNTISSSPSLPPDTKTALKQAIVIGNALIMLRSEHRHQRSRRSADEKTLIKTILRVSAKDSLLPTYVWTLRKLAASVWSKNVSLMNELKDNIETEGTRNFRQTINDIMGDCEDDINWGRIIVACGTALACVNVRDSIGIDYEIKRMLRKERLLRWITAHGGWEQLNLDHYINVISLACPRPLSSSNLPPLSSVILTTTVVLLVTSICGYVCCNGSCVK